MCRTPKAWKGGAGRKAPRFARARTRTGLNHRRRPQRERNHRPRLQRRRPFDPHVDWRSRAPVPSSRSSITWSRVRMPVSRLAPCVITASAIEQKEGGIWIWIWIWKRIRRGSGFVSGSGIGTGTGTGIGSDRDASDERSKPHRNPRLEKPQSETRDGRETRDGAFFGAFFSKHCFLLIKHTARPTKQPFSSRLLFAANPPAPRSCPQRGPDCHSAAVSAAVPQQFRSCSAAAPQQLRSSSAAAPQSFRVTSAVVPCYLRSRSVLLPPQ